MLSNYNFFRVYLLAGIGKAAFLLRSWQQMSPGFSKCRQKAAPTFGPCPPLAAEPVIIFAIARSVVIRSFPRPVGSFILSFHCAAQHAPMALLHFSHHQSGRCLLFCEPATPSGFGLLLPSFHPGSQFLLSCRSKKLRQPSCSSISFW